VKKSVVRLDPRAPFVLDVRTLGRRPGSMRPVQRTAPAPAGLAVEMIGVPVGAPVELDLRMESVVEGVLVSGTVTASLAGECARCLAPLTDSVTADVQELFVYPASTTDETSGEDEVSRLTDDLLDLEPVVRDAVVLALPLAPLCGEDCAGLCADCGQRLDDLPPDHTHQTLDPRWAALAERTEGSIGTTSSPDSQE
jgi:uncharacterized protein